MGWAVSGAGRCPQSSGGCSPLLGALPVSQQLCFGSVWVHGPSLPGTRLRPVTSTHKAYGLWWGWAATWRRGRGSNGSRRFCSYEAKHGDHVRVHLAKEIPQETEKAPATGQKEGLQILAGPVHNENRSGSLKRFRRPNSAAAGDAPENRSHQEWNGRSNGTGSCTDHDSADAESTCNVPHTVHVGPRNRGNACTATRCPRQQAPLSEQRRPACPPLPPLPASPRVQTWRAPPPAPTRRASPPPAPPPPAAAAG